MLFGYREFGLFWR